VSRGRGALESYPWLVVRSASMDGPYDAAGGRVCFGGIGGLCDRADADSVVAGVYSGGGSGLCDVAEGSLRPFSSRRAIPLCALGG